MAVIDPVGPRRLYRRVKSGKQQEEEDVEENQRATHIAVDRNRGKANATKGKPNLDPFFPFLFFY